MLNTDNDCERILIKMQNEINLVDENNIADDMQNNKDTENTENIENIENFEHSTREEYEKFIKTKYKKFYTEDTQKMINKRFKHVKELEENNNNLTLQLENIMQKNVDFENKLTTEDFVASLGNEVESLLEKHPSFSIDEEMQSPLFQILAKYAIEQKELSLNQIYEMVHFSDIKQKLKDQIEAETQQKMTASFKNQSLRPRENGIENFKKSSAKDVSKLTRSQRANIANRVLKGDIIQL